MITTGDVLRGTLTGAPTPEERAQLSNPNDRDAFLHQPDDMRRQLTRPGDILVCTQGHIAAICGTTGGHLPGQGVYPLRVTNPEQLDPHYLATVLGGS